MDIPLNPESWPRRSFAMGEGAQGAAGGEWPTADWPAPAWPSPDWPSPDWPRPDWPSPDWQGLAARLTATYALRRSLAVRDGSAYAASGSFHDAAAGVISNYRAPRDWQAPQAVAEPARGKPSGAQASGNDLQRCSHEVNPVASADGKGASGIAAGVVGDNASGDRGLK